jgi:hypothetical protein
VIALDATRALSAMSTSSAYDRSASLGAPGRPKMSRPAAAAAAATLARPRPRARATVGSTCRGSRCESRDAASPETQRVPRREAPGTPRALCIANVGAPQPYAIIRAVWLTASHPLQASVFSTIGFNLPGSPQHFAKVGSLRQSCWGA